MIHYPKPLHKGKRIGVTAPSSGVPDFLHHLLEESAQQFEKRGYSVVIGETAKTQVKAASATKEKRASELHQMLHDETIGAIIPPWGGELLAEILPLLNFEKIPPKWLVGYSDTSTLLLAVTLKTGIATMNSTNFVDVRSDKWDDVTAKFFDVLHMNEGDEITQTSSTKYQSKWNHEKEPNPYVFELDTPTKWKTIGSKEIDMEGRLLGSCIDTIRHLIGTPYGDVTTFQKQFIHDEPIIWYLENCEMSSLDFYRSLLQMKHAGWFDNCSGIVFGRTSAGEELQGFTSLDAMERIQTDLQIPVAYDLDLGHVPPQMTFVNGAWATIRISNGSGEMKMKLQP